MTPAHMALLLAALLGGAVIADLEADLARVEGVEGYGLDALMVLVGVGWGYDVDVNGVVHLVDGEFDLAGVAA